MSGVETAINKSATTTNRLEKNTQRVVNATTRVQNANKQNNRELSKANQLTQSLLSKAKLLASTYLGILGMKALVTTSDVITGTENKLGALNGYNSGATQESMDKMYVAAQNARIGYTDMMGNVAKSMTLAGDSFQDNIDNAIRFQEIMGKTYALGGASAAEQSSSMYQLIQALGAGKLQGDELRSMTEGAPLAAKAIEEYAQKLYGTTEALKDMGSQGLITSDIVVAAMMEMGEEIDTKFKNTSMTFAQAWENIKNSATKSFEPVLQMMNDGLNRLVDDGALEAIAMGFQFIANVVGIVFQAIGAVYTFIVDNWGVISKILLTIGAIAMTVFLVQVMPAVVAAISKFILYLGYLVAIATMHIRAGVSAVIGWMMANWALALVIGTLLLVIITLIWVSDSFADACGIIVGVVSAAISVVWNLFLTLVTVILKSVLLPLFTAWDSFANFFGNLFNDPLEATIRVFESWADVVFGIIRSIANGIDAIFGSNLAGAVNKWQGSLGGKIDSLASKYGNGTYEEKSNQAQKVEDLLNNVQTTLSVDTGSAYNSGYDLGFKGGEWLSNKMGGLTDSLFGATTLPIQNAIPNFDTTNLLDDIAGGVDDIGGSTGSIADSMELAEEDLTYLRDLANTEWKKEFTTANIVVDMNNVNTINNSGDLDGWVTKLTDKLYEELQSVADGVYV